VVRGAEGTSDRWEREPNRIAEMDPSENDVVLNDVNFISKMEFDRIPPNIFIGPYPQSVDDIRVLKKVGATAVLNVQTDEDIKHRGLNWPEMLAFYQSSDVTIARLQIADFNPESLENNIFAAAKLLNELFARGSKDTSVYVHCTAGMSRAAATVILYLAAFKGYGVQEAYEHVKKHRKVIAPNMGIVRKVAKRFIPEALERDERIRVELEEQQAKKALEEERSNRKSSGADADSSKQDAKSTESADMKSRIRAEDESVHATAS